MVKKYAFKRGQTVAFTPEEGVIVTGKIVGFTMRTAKYKKGGIPFTKEAAYNVEEPDVTLWACDEEDLTEVVDVYTRAAIEKPNGLTEAVMNDPLRDGAIHLKTYVVNALRRAGCKTIGDVIRMAWNGEKYIRSFDGLGQGSAKQIIYCLDRYLPGWRKELLG
jgi:hypothetical protein